MQMQKQHQPNRMLKAIKTGFLLLLATIIIVFAVTNRQNVIVFFDPLGQENVSSVMLPLFLVVLLSFAMGVLISGMMSWMKYSPYRRKVRRLEKELDQLKAEKISETVLTVRN